MIFGDVRMQGCRRRLPGLPAGMHAPASKVPLAQGIP